MELFSCFPYYLPDNKLLTQTHSSHTHTQTTPTPHTQGVGASAHSSHTHTQTTPTPHTQGVGASAHSSHTHTHHTHTTHTQGVGASAQGLVNAILFCAFTRVVRQKLTASLCCLSWRGKSTKVYLMQPTTPPASGGGLEDSTESERGESPGDIATKKCLLNGSNSIPKYGSINQGVSYTTE